MKQISLQMCSPSRKICGSPPQSSDILLIISGNMQNFKQFMRAEGRHIGEINAEGCYGLSIFLSMKYDDEEEYNKEIARIDHLMNECTTTELLSDSTYILTGSKQEIEAALDDRIYDGLCFQFEIVHRDEQNLIVCFYLAQVWDGAVPEEDKKMLQLLYDKCLMDKVQ